jgi:hypothetical protein
MRTLLPKKEKYLKEFAESYNKIYRQMRYGIAGCKPGIDEDLAWIRKQIIDWQSAADEDALCKANINYTTWMPVTYRNDTSVQYDQSVDLWGAGYLRGNVPSSPEQIGVGFAYGSNNQNIIEVNTGGCMTRINLNPAITFNNNSSFEFTQQTAATVWNISHNMGLKPNVKLENLQGEDIQGVVDYIDNNTVRVTFNQAVAGKAFLS